MILQESYLFFSNRLKNAKINNYSLEARAIFRQSLNLSDADFIVNSKLQISKEQIALLGELFTKREQGIPLAYILNQQFFWKNDFYVNENVLIPRQDSETLIQSFLSTFCDTSQFLNILEIGVGSGCLILSILDEYQNTKGLGVDVSNLALEVSKINAKKLGVENRVNLKQSDLFDNVQDKFDVIISNPPYIDENDTDIALDVKTFEPSIALFAKNNGLFFYEQILAKAKEFLNENGLIFFEIGHTQKSKLIDIAKNNGYIYKKTIKDLSNKDRVVILKKE